MRTLKVILFVTLQIGAVSLFALTYSGDSANKASIERLNSVDFKVNILEVRGADDDFTFNFINSKNDSGSACQIYKQDKVVQEQLSVDSWWSLVASLPAIGPIIAEDLYSALMLLPRSEDIHTGFNFFVSTDTQKATFKSYMHRGINAESYLLDDSYVYSNSGNGTLSESSRQKISPKEVYKQGDISVLNENIFMEIPTTPYIDYMANAQDIASFKVFQPKENEIWLYDIEESITFFIEEQAEGDIFISSYDGDKLLARTVFSSDFILNAFSHQYENGTSVKILVGYDINQTEYNIFIEEQPPADGEIIRYGYKCSVDEEYQLDAFLFQ